MLPALGFCCSKTSIAWLGLWGLSPHVYRDSILYTQACLYSFYVFHHSRNTVEFGLYPIYFKFSVVTLSGASVH